MLSVCNNCVITITLNYNKIKKKYLQKKKKKLNRLIQIFHHTKETGKNLNKTSIPLNVLFVSDNSEEIKLAYKSEYNYNRKNHVILLMINDEANNYYFVVKNLLELYSSGWLKSKKEVIINVDNTFQNALNNALNYQNIERDPQRISKLKRYISKYNWEGIEFPVGSKDWKKLEQIIRQLMLIYYLYHTIQKQ